MRDACRQWTGTTPSGDGNTAWCDQMVTWMSRHMGRWNNWEDWDNHMGDSHWMGNR